MLRLPKYSLYSIAYPGSIAAVSLTRYVLSPENVLLQLLGFLKRLPFYKKSICWLLKCNCVKEMTLINLLELLQTMQTLNQSYLLMRSLIWVLSGSEMLTSDADQDLTAHTEQSDLGIYGYYYTRCRA